MLNRSIGAAVLALAVSAVPAAALNLHVPKSVVAGLVQAVPGARAGADAACPLRSVADISVHHLAVRG